jgi:hypothetical protein
MTEKPIQPMVRHSTTTVHPCGACGEAACVNYRRWPASSTHFWICGTCSQRLEHSITTGALWKGKPITLKPGVVLRAIDDGESCEHCQGDQSAMTLVVTIHGVGDTMMTACQPCCQAYVKARQEQREAARQHP